MRARLKKLEDLPPEYLCCDVTRCNAASRPQIVIDITGTSHLESVFCPSCGHSYAVQCYDVVGQEFDIVSVNSIDLEEG